MFKGKKTYITAIVAIITAIGSYLVGDAQFSDTAQIIFTAILGATIRSGVTTEAAK